MRVKNIFIDQRQHNICQKIFKKNQNSKLCSIESKVYFNFLVLFCFVVFASNTKDSLSLLGRHFPNPNLKIANSMFPLTPTARARPMISVTLKISCEGTCIF